jgi:alkanesulfonate monooxygenase SsuD/methylene tetrahydromethanopterin reductase-like flavin-dependent oxidoreductase (luciferase family)
MRFGVQIPQEGVPFQAVLANARAAEDAGYDLVFIPDHLQGVAIATGAPAYEGWTTLTAVLTATSRVHGGLLVACEAFRPPAWFANACATLDHISGGRFVVGLGAGWYEAEFRSYGFPWGSGGERVARLDEYITAMKAAWRGEGYRGAHYAFEGTADLPVPLQQPHPPIWIGGQGDRMLDVIARHADVWNAPVLPAEEVALRADKLRTLCDGGRVPEITYEGPVWIDEDGDKIAARLERNRTSDNQVARTYARTAVAGTPEQVIARIRGYQEAGVTTFIAHFGKTTDLRGLQLFARTVMPAFEGETA